MTRITEATAALLKVRESFQKSFPNEELPKSWDCHAAVKPYLDKVQLLNLSVDERKVVDAAINLLLDFLDSFTVMNAHNQLLVFQGAAKLKEAAAKYRVLEENKEARTHVRQEIN